MFEEKPESGKQEKPTFTHIRDYAALLSLKGGKIELVRRLIQQAHSIYMMNAGREDFERIQDYILTKRTRLGIQIGIEETGYNSNVDFEELWFQILLNGTVLIIMAQHGEFHMEYTIKIKSDEVESVIGLIAGIM